MYIYIRIDYDPAGLRRGSRSFTAVGRAAEAFGTDQATHLAEKLGEDGGFPDFPGISGGIS